MLIESYGLSPHLYADDLLTHLLNFKRNHGNIQVNVRKDHRMRLSFLPEQLVRSSQQLVLMDTKKVFFRPWR